MHSVALLLQNQPDPATIQRIAIAALAIIPFLIAIGIAAVMVPCWFILKKAGMSPWLSLLCLLPSLGTLILLYIVAFSEWKVTPAADALWRGQPPFPPQPPYPPRA